ncbi:S1/P1 nuclease [Dysgonomonas sp. 520]|uniref:S1/P1 nuclease n=1 Tax=Dysgonomonas sp. 520 TaxID=2302931 RepID=UPI001C86A9FC|nr:S1/P1 nuclease [Dysgonomonas sp. 520]
MKRLFLLASLGLFLCGFPSDLIAWGTTGHRVITEIAQRNLNKKAKKQVDKLFDKQHLAYWANWADFIKSDTLNTWKHTSIWHYVNMPANMERNNFNAFIKDIEKDNVYSEIPKLLTILKDKNNRKEDRKIALIFLIHLVGDMHQPMHTGRADDLGGNRIKVYWFDRETNLHSLWDSALVDFEKYSYTEYATVLNVLTKDEKKAIQKGTLEDWLYDSHNIANRVYEISPYGSRLSYDYNFIVRPIVDSQLQKAGLRLAKILNDLW